MSSEEGKNRTGVSHRPYDEAFKRAAVAHWQSGVPASRVAAGLGITTESLRTWRWQFAGTPAQSATVVEGSRTVIFRRPLRGRPTRLARLDDLRLEVSPHPGYPDRLRAFPPHETRDIRKLRIDPYYGQLRGAPAMYPQTLGGFLLILHTEFFGGTAGASVVGLLGTGLMLLGISGLWLYGGFWKSFLTLRWRRSARIFFSDLHKTVGISSVAFNLLLGFTGVW